MSHFEFQVLDSGGVPKGNTITIKSFQCVVLHCPSNMLVADIEHICKMAMQTPDYPHDLVMWGGKKPNKFLLWSARIQYRSNADVENQKTDRRGVCRVTNSIVTTKRSSEND